ncbi:MAG: ankyrin repeat domain-containing protein [Planctomycetales bacterium]|jgi:hypothetical protein
MLHRFFVATVSLSFLTGCGGAESSAPVEAPAETPAVEAGAPSASTPVDEQDSADGSATTPEESVNTAAFNNDVDTLKRHIAAGSDLNEKEPTNGGTPLISAVTFDRQEAAKVLIDGGADLTIKNNEGSTALYIAAFLCRTEIVEMLLEAGVNKEAMNKSGATALNSVEGPFEPVKPIYDLIGAILGPLGLKLDYERIKATRPKIAEMLR